MTCDKCGKAVTEVRGSRWHTGDPFHQLHDHTPTSK